MGWSRGGRCILLGVRLVLIYIDRIDCMVGWRQFERALLDLLTTLVIHMAMH